MNDHHVVNHLEARSKFLSILFTYLFECPDTQFSSNLVHHSHDLFASSWFWFLISCSSVWCTCKRGAFTHTRTGANERRSSCVRLFSVQCTVSAFLLSCQFSSYFILFVPLKPSQIVQAAAWLDWDGWSHVLCSCDYRRKSYIVMVYPNGTISLDQFTSVYFYPSLPCTGRLPYSRVKGLGQIIHSHPQPCSYIPHGVCLSLTCIQHPIPFHYTQPHRTRSISPPQEPNKHHGFLPSNHLQTWPHLAKITSPHLELTNYIPRLRLKPFSTYIPHQSHWNRSSMWEG